LNARYFVNTRDIIINYLINKLMQKLGFPSYAIVVVNFIQTLDKASVLKLIATNMGMNKYVILLIYILALI